MNHLFTTILGVLMSIIAMNAQDLAFEKGVNVAQIGVGLSSYHNPTFAINAAYERGLFTFGEKFTIGAEGCANIAPANGPSFEVSVGPTLHYSPNEHFDVYVGPTVYYYKAGNFSHLGFLGQVGVRYYFTKAIGIFANVGGIGVGSAGLAIKF